MLKHKFTNELNPDSYFRLEKMVGMVFIAAIEDDQSSAFYARLSRFIHDTWKRKDKYSFWFNKDTNKYETIKWKNAKAAGIRLKSFREVLLSRIQHEFIKLKILPAKDKSQFEEGYSKGIQRNMNQASDVNEPMF